MQRVEAEILIPGRGEPVRDGVVVLDGPCIAYAGIADAAPATPGAPVVRATAAMPGMWDCHAHLFGVATLDLERLAATPVALRAARSVPDLRAALDAGFTSVRELGGLGIHLATAIAEGSVVGPSIYPAGAILSTTGGHGDIHGFPTAWVHQAAQASPELRLCDGEADCIRAVREQLRSNAKVIKVCVSGGVASEVDDPMHQQFTAGELSAMVEVAGMAERAVAAHCHGKAGIMAAVEAGVHTVEHGTYLDEEACDAMRETGTILVATRTVVDDLRQYGQLPPAAHEKLLPVAERHAEAIALAHERGVTIAAGSDIGLRSGGPSASWGRHGREPVLLHDIGMTPLEAIEAVTATALRTLGPQAPNSGVLTGGYDADVITLDANPLVDIDILAEPDHVTAVWKAGVRCK